MTLRYLGEISPGHFDEIGLENTLHALDDWGDWVAKKEVAFRFLRTEQEYISLVGMHELFLKLVEEVGKHASYEKISHSNAMAVLSRVAVNTLEEFLINDRLMKKFGGS